MTEPTTEAGRRLLEREAYNGRSFVLIELDAILAIEAEARASLDVERWRMVYDPDHDDRSFIDGWNAALDAILDGDPKP